MYSMYTTFTIINDSGAQWESGQLYEYEAETDKCNNSSHAIILIRLTNIQGVHFDQYKLRK